jgi:chemotaxis protein histidine kinase CheA
MDPADSHAASTDLAAALDRLWHRFLPELRERVAIVESAVHSLASAALTPAQQEDAHAAAHKLAGVLGTFNLERGTDLARELELAFDSAPDPASAPRLAQSTAELRALIDARK